jgi:hypothetical protein
MKLQRFTNGVNTAWGLAGGLEEMAALLSIPDPNDNLNLMQIIMEGDLVPFVDPFFLLKATGEMSINQFAFQIVPALSPAETAVVLFLEREERPVIAIDWQQLNATPEVAKFQITHKWWPCAGFNRAYELGRFFTRKNEIGLITSMQTELTFVPNDQRWPRGDSAWFRRNLDVNVGEVNVSWCLKIEGLPHEDPDPAGFRVVTVGVPANWINEIPGQVHPEIAPWNENIFLAGIDHFVHFRCPQNTWVSLWVFRHEDLTDDGLWAFAGIMKGYTQIMDSARAYENMTRIY